MCPLWPFHLLLLYVILLWPLWLVCSGSKLLNGTFDPSPLKGLVEGTSQEVVFISAVPVDGPLVVDVLSSDLQIAKPSDGNGTLSFNMSTISNFSFFMTGNFLGHTSVKLRVVPPKTGVAFETKSLPVSVIRKKRTIDDVFVYSVAIIVSLVYLNMGATIDLDVVKSTLKKPIGPAVGLVSQYIFMPLVSFGLSYVIFTSPNMRLGLFTLGCSPGGGASNMWTFLLGGNLNLSITMTFISNVMAFVTMPAWLFSLGRIIFESSKVKIPYQNIVTSLVALVIPVGIGLAIQRYLPKVAKVAKRILGPFSGFMIIFIVVFGTYANLYMFSLFEWRVVIGALCVPWLGYAFGAILARLFKFPFEDCVAVAVETGIQNTGISIVLLRFSLPQPDADLTSVIPVAAALMMPIPLLLLWMFLKVRKYLRRAKEYEMCREGGSSGESSDNDISKLENVDKNEFNGNYISNGPSRY